jgi:6-pyruvoyltetrahydropterin/6-carboxytetrahydropterin synthase
MVCNLVDLDGFVEREVLSRFDHENLNTLQEFAQKVPTTENLCIADLRNSAARLPKAHLERVRLEETMMNSFEYRGGRRPTELGIFEVELQLQNYKLQNY